MDETIAHDVDTQFLEEMYQKWKNSSEEAVVEELPTTAPTPESKSGEPWYYEVIRSIIGDDFEFDAFKEALYIRFKNIEIVNSASESTKIEELFVRVGFKEKTGFFGEIQGLRTKYSYVHYIADYHHSHLPREASYFNNFCLGGNTPIRLTWRALCAQKTKFDAEALISFLLNLVNYVSWESTEGGPYFRMGTIERNFQNRQNGGSSRRDSRGMEAFYNISYEARHSKHLPSLFSKLPLSISQEISPWGGYEYRVSPSFEIYEKATEYFLKHNLAEKSHLVPYDPEEGIYLTATPDSPQEVRDKVDRGIVRIKNAFGKSTFKGEEFTPHISTAGVSMDTSKYPEILKEDLIKTIMRGLNQSIIKYQLLKQIY